MGIDRQVQEKLKLDKIMRVLFNLSNKVTIDLINALFNEEFVYDEVKGYYEYHRISL